MKRTKSAIGQLASTARRRLLDGFWAKNHKSVDLQNINDMNGEDERFYRRVFDILQTGETNPLAVLLDTEYMAKVDDATRQRYVLTTSARVQKCVARYHESVVAV